LKKGGVGHLVEKRGDQNRRGGQTMNSRLDRFYTGER